MEKFIYGITGSLGSGKSFISQTIKAQSSQKITVIELDNIRRYVLWSSIEPQHIHLRKQLIQNFNLQPLNEFYFFDRNIFTKLIFESKKSLSLYSNIVTPILKEYINNIIEYEECSYFFIVWAYLIEENYLELLNSSIILVNCDSEYIISRLKNKQEYSADVLDRILLEPSYQSRVDYLKKISYSFIEINNNQDSKDLNLYALTQTLNLL